MSLICQPTSEDIKQHTGNSSIYKGREVCGGGGGVLVIGIQCQTLSEEGGGQTLPVEGGGLVIAMHCQAVPGSARGGWVGGGGDVLVTAMQCQTLSGTGRRGEGWQIRFFKTPRIVFNKSLKRLDYVYHWPN